MAQGRGMNGVQGVSFTYEASQLSTIVHHAVKGEDERYMVCTHYESQTPTKNFYEIKNYLDAITL
jgi:hypothetical protein